MADGKIVYDVDVNDDGVEGKVQQTNSKIESAANKGSGAFGEVWTGALRAVGAKMVELGQLAISSAVDVGKEALAQVASFEQLQGGVEKLFGQSAGAVVDNAKKAFETAGMSANDYMENVTSFSAALISACGNDTKEAANLADMAIVSMSDNANVFGSDMQSIQNAYQGMAKGNYSMLDNLKLGYQGTKEEMARLIKDASELTDVQNELGITVDGTSMDFANCVKAIQVMQTQMNIAGTTSKEASGTIEGSVKSMKAAWQNFLTGTMNGDEFARVALNAADNVVNALMDIIPRLIDGFAQMAPTLWDKAVEIIGNLVTTIKGKLPEFVEQGTEMIRNLGQGLAQQIPEFIHNALPMIMEFTANLRENAGKFIDAGIDMILNIAQGLADSLPDLIAYVPTIISNIVGILNDNMPKILSAGLKIIITLAKGIVEAIPALIENFPKIVKMIFDILQAIDWLNLGKFIINGIGNGIKALISMIPDLFRNIGNNAHNLLRNIDWRNLGSTIINFILNGIRSLMHSIPDVLRNIGHSAMDAIRSIDWWDLGWNIIRGIISGLSSGASEIVHAARDVARRALDAAKDFLGINSPSTEFKLVGQYSDEGQAEGMIKNADLVEDASKEVAKRALDAQMSVDYDLPDIESASRDMSANIAGSFAQTTSRVIEVPLSIDSREIARATAWDMGEQLAWEAR